MVKEVILRFFGVKAAGWANLYLREDGTKMTGGMLYITKEQAKSKGLCAGANSKYIGTKKLYY